MKMPFKKIIIGIDFSDASLAGARWVADHLAPKADLLLVHVVAVPRPPIYLREHIPPTIDQRSTLVPRLYTALREFAVLLGREHVRVGIRTGVPWSAIARVAEEVKADLICVGRGNKRQGSSRFGATTSERLVGVSGVPVLVIPQGVVTKPSRVLAALSGRPGAERVMPVAKSLASAWGSRLEAIHVVEADVRQHSRMSIGANRTHLLGTQSADNRRIIGIDALDESALCTLASQWIASTISELGATSSLPPAIRIGDAGQELITSARNEPGPSVVVMGRVGETFPMAPEGVQYRCGSTTRMVLWAAPGPILVLPLESSQTDALPLAMQARRLDMQVPTRTEEKAVLPKERFVAYSHFLHERSATFVHKKA
jgi:nucleotide-binding universal stress UspA family protein